MLRLPSGQPDGANRLDPLILRPVPIDVGTHQLVTEPWTEVSRTPCKSNSVDQSVSVCFGIAAHAKIPMTEETRTELAGEVIKSGGLNRLEATSTGGIVSPGHALS